VDLSYRQLELILAAYLSVHPDKIGTFRSRMKQLQRLEFPAGVNIGRGVRMTYNAEHLLQLAVAFEVIGTGLAAKAATDLVSGYWERFQAAFGRAHRLQVYGSDAETFVCIEGKPPIEPEQANSDIVCVHDLASLTEYVLCATGHRLPLRAGMILIRADSLLVRVTQLARDVGQVPHARWAPEYAVWTETRNKHQQQWDKADGGVQPTF